LPKARAAARRHTRLPSTHAARARQLRGISAFARSASDTRFRPPRCRCNKLQPLDEFEGSKHTCKTRLEAHNARRRNQEAVRRSQCSSPTASGEHSSDAAPRALGRACRSAERGSRARAAAAFAAGAERTPPHGQEEPRGTAVERAAAAAASLHDTPALEDALVDGLFDLTDWVWEEFMERTGDASSSLAPPCANATVLEAAAAAQASYMRAFSDGYSVAAAAAAADAAASMRADTLHVKLTHARPDELPTGLLLGTVQTLFSGPFGLHACVRPGCTLLTLEALAHASAAPQLPPQAVVERLLAAPGAMGTFFRAQREFIVRVGGAEASFTAAAGVRAGAAPVARAPRAPPLSPLAVQCTSDAALVYDASRGVGELPLPDAVHCCRLHGHVLPIRADGSAVMLPAGDAEGVALFEALPPGVPLHCAAEPRPVLLTRSAAVAAEVAAMGAALPVEDAAARAHAERVVCVLGCALRPGAEPEVVEAAAAAAIWFGWPATLTRLLVVLQPLSEDAAAKHFMALLRHAAAAERLDMVRILVRQHAPLAMGAVLAATLLADAEDAGHLQAELAVLAALDALQEQHGAASVGAAPPHVVAAAAAVLRVIAAALDGRPLDELVVREGEAELAAADLVGTQQPQDAAASPTDEAAFLRWLAELNVVFWKVISVLIILGNVDRLYKTWKFILQQDGADAILARGGSTHSLLAQTRLHDPYGASPPIGPLEVPWAVAVAYTRAYTHVDCMVRIPNGLLLMLYVFTVPRMRRGTASAARLLAHHGTVTLLSTVLDIAFFLLLDCMIWRATGRAVEWPAAFGVIQAIGISLAHHTGPANQRWTYVQMCWRLVCTVGVLAYAGKWRVLATNYGYAAQVLVMCLNMALAPSRDAKLRRMYAQHCAAVASSKRKKLE
jgi:hypothetical protein